MEEFKNTSPKDEDIDFSSPESFFNIEALESHFAKIALEGVEVKRDN